MQHGGPREAIEAFLGVVCEGLWERLDDGRREGYRDNGELLMPALEAVGSTLTLDDVAAITVPAEFAGLVFVDGKLARVLEPGARSWRTAPDVRSGSAPPRATSRRGWPPASSRWSSWTASRPT